VNPSKSKLCQSCKNTGKILSQRTREFHGVKRTTSVLIDCPCRLTELIFLGWSEPAPVNRFQPS
jgi:hypothetical protein